MFDKMDERIEAARAAQKRVDDWAAVVSLANELPQLLAEKERRQRQAEHRAKLAQAVAEVRDVLVQVAEATVTWRRGFLEFCGTSPREVDLIPRINALTEIQKPVFEAQARLQAVAGPDFERAWAGAGGHDPRLAPLPDNFEKTDWHYYHGFLRLTRGGAYLPCCDKGV